MRYFTLLGSCTLAAAVAVTVVPVMAQVANPNPKAIAAGSYKVDTHHTLVQFTVVHMGFSEFFGTFPGTTGTLDIDPARPAATKLDVTVPVASVSTTNAKLDGELVSAGWFDAARFPEMRFVSTSVTPIGANRARVTGNLTLHGVTKPVTLAVTYRAGGANPMSKAITIGFDAQGTLKRSDFGVSKFIPVVSDEVGIRLAVAFEKK